MMRPIASLLIFSFTVAGFISTSSAHHPNRECETVRPRIDVIGPLGNKLRPSYRRELNRPRFLGGKIAYMIAPTSQEAMAWHRAEHRGDYAKNAGRHEPHYMYPKPWEALKIGPRRSSRVGGDLDLQPIAGGDAMSQGMGQNGYLDDPMAFSDGEEQGPQSTADTPIIDTPADEPDQLPEPPSSPSDMKPDAPEEDDSAALESIPSNAIGSGLRGLNGSV